MRLSSESLIVGVLLISSFPNSGYTQQTTQAPPPEAPSITIQANPLASTTQQLDNDLAILEVRLEDLAVNRRRLNAIRSNQTAFAAGSDLAALGNPTQYTEFNQVLTTLQELLPRGQYNLAQGYRDEAVALAEQQSRPRVGGELIPGAMRQILGPIGGLLAEGITGASRDAINRLLRRHTPTCLDRGRCWPGLADQFQTRASAIFRFVQYQNDRNATLVSRVGSILQTEENLRDQIDRQLTQIALLGGIRYDSAAAAYTDIERILSSTQARAESLQTAASAEEGGRRLIRFSAELHQIVAADHPDAEVNDLHRQVRQFYRDALARTAEQPGIEGIPSEVNTKYTTLAQRASNSLRDALAAYETSYRDASRL